MWKYIFSTDKPQGNVNWRCSAIEHNHWVHYAVFVHFECSPMRVQHEQKQAKTVCRDNYPQASKYQTINGSLVLLFPVKSVRVRKEEKRVRGGSGGADSTCTYTLRPSTSDNIRNLHNNVIIICLSLSSAVPWVSCSSTKSACNSFGKGLAS